ncbi:MAG: translation initiation factor IF-2 [Helicobacteraceae bacterium]|nr:translation initiation factor IF-2 [Helicobacteraceae bacterium]
MSEKVRVHEIAKELGINSKEVVEKSTALGLSVKTASSSVSMEEAEKIMNYIMNGAPEQESTKLNIVKKASTKEKSETVEETNTKDSSSEETIVETKKEDKTAEPKITEKVDTEKVDIEKVKTETVKAEDVKDVKKPSTATSEIKVVQAPKRSGLKIVKKKKPKPVEVDYSSNDRALANISSYGKMSQAAQAELTQKKKRTATGSAARKHEHGKRIDAFGGDMADVSMDIEGEQVVLMDLNETDRKVDPFENKPNKPREKKPVGRNGGKARAPSRGRSVSRGKKKKYVKETRSDEVVTHVEIPEDIRVYEFAEKLNRPMIDIIKVLFNLGMMATKNDFLGKDEIEILAEEFEVEVTTIDPKDAFNYVEDYEEEDENATERAPVITIMGHVDHGKTSLLDAIRNSRVTKGEAGGITQHIGAYSISKNNKDITFIDTPGHAAFTGMRNRGVQVTDIIVIVVAADDGVKPQTKEVIKLAKESGAPIIVAINKMDKEGANPDFVKGQMAELEVTPVDWGGDVEFVPVSAIKGEGLEELLETILLTADVLELKAVVDAPAKAIVVESSVEKGFGSVGTIIVQNGTLKVGDNVVCGSAYGRVKTLLDSNKQRVKEVGPSGTAIVVGLNEVPVAGETLMAMDSDKEVKEFATKRAEYERAKELSKSTKSTMEDLTNMIAEGKLKSLKVVLKTDVHGSLEAIRSALEEMRNEEVKINIISSSVGGITANDVELVNNSDNCILLGFNVRPTGAVKADAKQKGVDIRTYSIIYNLLDDVTEMLTGMMSAKFTEENTGQAEVKETFKIPKGIVAGCMVNDGKLVRGGLVRVIRDGVVIYEGDLTSLKRFKDDVAEVGNGYECGVVISGYDDVVAGDVIETFKKVEQKVEL